MKTTTLQNLSPHQVFTDNQIFYSIPFPAIIFDFENNVTLLSNSFFNNEHDILLLDLLKKYKYFFLNENDILILNHRISNESHIHTQRIENNRNELIIYDIHLSRLPDANYALLFFNQTRTSESTYHQNQFFKNLIHSITEGIAIIDENNVIKFCNHSFVEIFGKDDNLTEENILALFDSHNRLIFESELENLRLFLDSTFELSLKSDKSDRHILFHLIPQKNNGVKYAGSILTLLDITERISMERELIIAKEKAQEADSLKSTFLANMSHEIRTPMNCIIGFSSLLKKEELVKKKRDQYIDIIISRGKQLLEIINDIIDITKIEENQMQLSIAPYNLKDVFNDLKLYYTNELKELGKQDLKLIFKTSFSKNDTIILTDSFRLQQILSNLLSNAVKFTNNGFIEAGYYIEDNENLLFYVKDTGIGISKEMHRIIFDRFRQADESFTRNYGGTGLGLSICDGLLKLFGGKIWVESDGTNGSTFYFTLPYHPFKETKNIDNKVDSYLDNTYNWANQNILIVEDDFVSYEYLNEILIHTNCNIYHAANGKEALEIFRLRSIDLILLDIQLPEMDGFQIAKTVRKINASIPIIAQTAHAMAEDRQRCIDAGCTDYISKPLQYEMLLTLINKYLHSD